MQISKELDRFSFSAEIKQAVLDCVWPRQQEVRQSLVQNTAMISNAHLKDFNWKVKVSRKILSLQDIFYLLVISYKMFTSGIFFLCGGLLTIDFSNLIWCSN